MAKRSPILGYNHNARYRGLVFHVQTEDSGVLSPHLFTHLFYNGVIVSTRKYVYDSDSTEEAIKSLMQAQHKAVMKDLRRGHFDDKIDQYLGGTPGLLPRGAVGVVAEESAEGREPNLARASQVGIGVDVAAAMDDPMAATTFPDGGPALAREATLEEPTIGLRPTEPAVEPPPEARAPTVLSARRATPAEGAPEQLASAMASPPAGTVRPYTAEELYATMRNESPGDSHPEITVELELDEEADEPVTMRREIPPGARRRRPADTETMQPWEMTQVNLSPMSDGVPGTVPGAGTARSGDITGAVTGMVSGPPTGPISRTAKAVGAASLPPARPIARPPSRPAIVPPPVVSKSAPVDDRRTPTNEVVEVYAQPEDLEEQAPERPGQYSQHKKISTRIPSDSGREGSRPQPAPSVIPQLVRPGSAPVIPPPTRPGASQRITQSAPGRPPTPVSVPMPARPGTSPAVPAAASPPVTPSQRATAVPMPARPGTASPVPGTLPSQAPPPPVPAATVPPPMAAPPISPPPTPSRTNTPPAGTAVARPSGPPSRPPVPPPVPAAVAKASEPVRETEPVKSRTMTPQRVSTPPAPAAAASSGTGGLSPGRPNPNSGVVMSRPVIVGGPGSGKAAVTTPRVRKAREEESRSFGQGLISEKSLDEVILAYLSEDPEDK